MNDSLPSDPPRSKLADEAPVVWDFPVDSPAADRPPPRRRIAAKWLAGLVAVHVGTAGVVVWWTSAYSLSRVVEPIFWGLIFAQATLVALWLSMGQGVVARLLGYAVAVVLLAKLVDFEGPGDFFWMAIVIMAVLLGALALLLLALRYGPPRLRLTRQPGDNVIAGLQFSIRGLMLLTAAVAIALAIGPGIRGGLNRARGDVPAVAAIALIIATTCLVSTLGTTWATLGQVCNWRRLLSGVALGVAASTLPAMTVEADDRLLFVWMFLVQSLALAGSLLMLRAAGFRVVRDVYRPWRYETRSQEPVPHPLA